MSPLDRCRYFSTDTTGFDDSPQTCCARRMTPAITMRSLFFVRLDRPVSESRHASIASAVIASSGWPPDAGRRWALRLER
jgi:hypothetical protein